MKTFSRATCTRSSSVLIVLETMIWIYPHSLHVYLMRSLAWLTNDITSVYSNKCTARIIVHSISNYSINTRQKVDLSAPQAPGMGSNTEALVNYHSQLNHHCCTYDLKAQVK